MKLCEEHRILAAPKLFVKTNFAPLDCPRGQYMGLSYRNCPDRESIAR